MKLRRAFVAAIILLAILSLITLQIVTSSQEKLLLRNVVSSTFKWQHNQLQVVGNKEAEVAETELDETEVAKTDHELDETELDSTKSKQTRKPFNPDMDLTLLRDASFGKIPDKVSVACSEMKVGNPTPYRNKQHCCQEAEAHYLPELCGWINASAIGNESHVQGCTCHDFMACKTVILTATSSNHWLESLDAIGSVQNIMPDMKIIMMDIGMNEEEVEQLQRLRNVEIRRFPFETYPPHVEVLEKFAWKPLAIQKILSEYEIVFFMDASIRLRRPLVDVLFPDIQKFPIRVYANEYYEGAFTMEATYKYLGVTRKQVGKRLQKEGGLTIFRNCSFLQERIVSALVDCALHEECIAPSGSSPYGCDYDNYKEQVKQIDTIEEVTFIGCHRFDRSVLTVVLDREFHFPNDHYVVDPAGYHETMEIWKQPTKCFTVFLNDNVK